MSGHCSFCGVWHSGSCCHPARGWVEALCARVRELEGALEKYGEHCAYCRYMRNQGKSCDCGLESVRPAPAPGSDTTAGWGTTTSRDLVSEANVTSNASIAAGGNDGE